MGAEPGRRTLKIPAEKLGPVIVAITIHVLVSPNDKWFYSYLGTSIAKFPRNVFYFILRILALVIGSCDPV